MELLNIDGVLAHPGYFFDFPRESFLIVSLLPPEDQFATGVERLFARDAEYGGGRGGMARGPAAIRARLEAAPKVNAAPAPGRDWHFLFNETIDVHGDEATAISMGAFFVRGDGNKLESNSIATYSDDLVREDSMWKFKRRVLGAGPRAAAPASATPAR